MSGKREGEGGGEMEHRVTLRSLVPSPASTSATLSVPDPSHMDAVVLLVNMRAGTPPAEGKFTCV